MSKYIQALGNLPVTLSYLLHRTSKPGEDLQHLRAAAQWLLKSQPAGESGYAHSFHLARGWLPPYPETTGYILPTLLAANKYLGLTAIPASVSRALMWLEKIQSADGSYKDLNGQPQVFDTGQILIGLAYIADRHPGLHDVSEMIIRAAEWLMSVQEEDGSFIACAYNERPHSYYARVGAALVQAGQLMDRQDFIETGLHNIDWTLAQQQKNGLFKYSSFDDQPPFLHTMIYVIEGLLDAHELVGHDACYQASLRFSTALLAQGEGQGQGRGLPRSQYNEKFSIANSEFCLTGLAQWATVCLRLHHLSGEAAYLTEAQQIISYLKSRQIMSGNVKIRGALPGSVPISGSYMRYAFPNWGVKFFMDSLLAKMEAETRAAA